MSRLIDADEAIRRIRKLWVESDEPIEEAWRHSDYAFALYDAIEAVDDTPDAAGVITCRDCVYCETRIIRGEMVGHCEFFGDTKLYHYCGLAEARE